MKNCEYANNIKYTLGDEENTTTVATAANRDDDDFNQKWKLVFLCITHTKRIHSPFVLFARLPNCANGPQQTLLLNVVLSPTTLVKVIVVEIVIRKTNYNWARAAFNFIENENIKLKNECVSV